MCGKGSSWSAWTMAAPVSASFVRSKPTASSVQPGAPSPPEKRLHMSWCGSMNRQRPWSAASLRHCPHVVEIRLVVDARPGVLDRLPGDQEAQEREPPRAKPREDARRPPRAGRADRRRRRRDGRRSPRAGGSRRSGPAGTLLLPPRLTPRRISVRPCSSTNRDPAMRTAIGAGILAAPHAARGPFRGHEPAAIDRRSDGSVSGGGHDLAGGAGRRILRARAADPGRGRVAGARRERRGRAWGGGRCPFSLF